MHQGLKQPWYPGPHDADRAFRINESEEDCFGVAVV